MPELPEVQTITNGLNKKLTGLKITDVWCDVPKIIKNSSLENFKKEIIGKKFLDAKRKGKNILIHLSEDMTILFHMKMTGHLLYGNWIKKDLSAKAGNFVCEDDKKYFWKPTSSGPLCDPYNRFIHFIFYFSNGKELAFSDARKFGKILLLKTKGEMSSNDLRKLGPDALDKNFTFKKFKEALAKKKDGFIKQILLDQEVIAGIGNIYSDEILWSAGIHPKEKLSKLKDGHKKKIFDAMKRILKNSVKLGGDSMSDFRNLDGEKGKYQEHHKAYRRTGEPCPKVGCKGKIIRTKVAGRSAHFCETHQKLF